MNTEKKEALAGAVRPNDAGARRYQDYVIRDGEFIGEFEKMYANCEDPWLQMSEDMETVSRVVGTSICRRLRTNFGSRRVLEIGCGFGRYANLLSQIGLDVIGLDISSSAIAKAQAAFPHIAFEVGGIEQLGRIEKLAPDIIVMSHVTWYVLPKLRAFLDFLRLRLPDTMLYHIVSTYDADEQKYGRDYFSAPEEIRSFFGMVYYEWGEIHSTLGTDAYFLGSWSDRRLSLWRAISPESE